MHMIQAFDSDPRGFQEVGAGWNKQIRRMERATGIHAHPEKKKTPNFSSRNTHHEIQRSAFPALLPF